MPQPITTNKKFGPNTDGKKSRYNRTNQAFPTRKDFCFYHRVYGVDAEKCKDETEAGGPCKWINNYKPKPRYPPRTEENNNAAQSTSANKNEATTTSKPIASTSALN